MRAPNFKAEEDLMIWNYVLDNDVQFSRKSECFWDNLVKKMKERSAGALRQRFSRLCEKLPEAQLSIEQKLKLYKKYSISVKKEYLEKLKKHAELTVNEEGVITSYSLNRSAAKKRTKSGDGTVNHPKKARTSADEWDEDQDVHMTVKTEPVLLEMAVEEEADLPQVNKEDGIVDVQQLPQVKQELARPQYHKDELVENHDPAYDGYYEQQHLEQGAGDQIAMMFQMMKDMKDQAERREEKLSEVLDLVKGLNDRNDKQAETILEMKEKINHQDQNMVKMVELIERQEEMMRWMMTQMEKQQENVVKNEMEEGRRDSLEQKLSAVHELVESQYEKQAEKMQEMEERLEKQGTESMAAIQEEMKTMRKEIRKALPDDPTASTKEKFMVCIQEAVSFMESPAMEPIKEKLVGKIQNGDTDKPLPVDGLLPIMQILVNTL